MALSTPPRICRERTVFSANVGGVLGGTPSSFSINHPIHIKERLVSELEPMPRGMIAALCRETGLSYFRCWAAVRADNWNSLSRAEELALRQALLRRKMANRDAELVTA